jgi:hypothetical protein
VGIRDTIRRWKRGEGPGQVHVGDPRFDDWEPVRDFENVKAAQAWREHLANAGYEAVLTADWPLDRLGRGDIALRVPPEQWSEAEALLDNLDD